MIIKPRVKDFICLTSHPEGCKEKCSPSNRICKKSA